MAAPPRMPGPVLVGRERELGSVSALLNRAFAGEAHTILLSGNAGTGKTMLAQVAAAEHDGETFMLSGACLPMTSASVPHLAIRTAIAGFAEAESHPPPRIDGEAYVPVSLDAWIDSLCRSRPVLLVVDDLQWADPGTLDSLMYLIAGPAARRLAIVLTVRSGEFGADDPLERWLADTRRMPRVVEFDLHAFDLATTGDQMAALLDEPPHRSLVVDAYARSRGNPYFTRLIVADLDAGDRHVPPSVPSDLRSAVLHIWFRLPRETRRVCTILAVAAVPLTAQELSRVISEESDARAVGAMLRDAVDAGVLDAGEHGFWFHHPLSAEVLVSELDDSERIEWHQAFALFLERRHTLVSPHEAAAIADHRADAGDEASAYEWSLRATSQPESLGADERVRLLERAVGLRPRVPGAPDSSIELLQRLRVAAEAAGAHEIELVAVEALLAELNGQDAPLDVAELLVDRMKLRFLTGREFVNRADIVRAVELSSRKPTSWQHALALAELAHTELWLDHTEGGLHAVQAVAASRASGNPKPLSFALTARAMSSMHDGDAEGAREAASEAVSAAVEARDWWAFAHATSWEATATAAGSSARFAQAVQPRREMLTQLGAPNVYIAALSAQEASGWFVGGHWQRVEERLRVTLGSDPGPLADVAGRLTAARLATWQGRQSEAEAHLARAGELTADRENFRNFAFDVVRAEVFLGGGRPEAAYEAACDGLDFSGPPPMSEWLLPLSARALADIAQIARDHRGDEGEAISRLDSLLRRFPEIVPDWGPADPVRIALTTALQALYDAECMRARADAEAGTAFAVAADACSEADLAWEEAYAAWRAAELLLTAGRTARRRGVELLRRGVALAERLRAQPILAALEGVAERARVVVRPRIEQGGAPAVPTGLTAREAEVLALISAGLTYGEIARELVISEKTVSSHVSHLLAKTGTANRMELSGLARRTGI